MSFTFRTNRIPELKEKLKGLPRRELQAIGAYLAGEARLRCPVDTGRLKGSIDYKVSILSFIGNGSLSIGSNVDYAIFVHEGTRYQAARRFITDAVNENTAYINNMILNNLLRGF